MFSIFIRSEKFILWPRNNWTEATPEIGIRGRLKRTFCHLFSQLENSFISDLRIFGHGELEIIFEPLWTTTEAQMTQLEPQGFTCKLDSAVCKSIYPFILAAIFLCLTLLVKNTFIWTSCSVINRDGAFHKFNQSKWCFHPWICMVGLPSSTELDLDEYGQKHRSENRGMDRNNHWNYLKY